MYNTKQSNLTHLNTSHTTLLHLLEKMGIEPTSAEVDDNIGMRRGYGVEEGEGDVDALNVRDSRETDAP